jgi:hypothetical protein
VSLAGGPATSAAQSSRCRWTDVLLGRGGKGISTCAGVFRALCTYFLLVLRPAAPVALLVVCFSSTSSDSFSSVSIRSAFFARCFAVALDAAGVLDAAVVFGAVLGACLPVAAGPRLRVCGALDLVFMIGVLGVDVDGCGWMRAKHCGCRCY